MAKNTTVYYTKEGRWATTSGIPNVPTLVFTAGADGSKILSIIALNAGTYTLYYNNGSDQKILEAVVIAAVNDDLLTLIKLPLNAAGSKYFNMEGAATLKALEAGGAGEIAIYAEDF